MSKKLLKVVAGVAVIGLTVFSGGLGLPAVGLLGMKIGVGTLLAAGIGIGAGILLKPKAPRVSENAASRLQATLDVHAPRKIVFGNTAMATDVRYQGYTGTDQEYLHWIMCVASHPVESIDEIWFDTKLAWSASGGVQSDYTGYLTIATRNPGTSGNGIAIDSVWTSSCTLTGCAYVHLRFKLTGNTKKAESPFAQAIPSRVTVRGKGAFLPDLREGGVSAGTQTTWDWFDADSGRNAVNQLLFYLIGWRINGKLAIGRGIPPERLNLDSFITAANLCDEAVTLAAGGTEPRYRGDGVFSEADDPNLVIGTLCASMNAVLRDDGGTIGIYVLHNDLGSPVCAFTEDDIIDGDDWEQTPAVDQFYNIVRGRYPDPSNANLYQLVDYPEVEIASVDSIDRVDTFDLAHVQSPSQAQRLAKQRLQRNLYRGVFSARFNYRAWQVSLGDPVTLSHAALGWEDKLFRVAGQNISIDGTVALVLTEENADIYAWDADESPAVQPADPTSYDPLLSPFIQGLDDAITNEELPTFAFNQDEPPSAAESKPGVYWLDSDDGYAAYERVEGDGFVRDDLDVLVLDDLGNPIEAAWTTASDQRLRDAITAAADAQAAADAAIDAIADLADDGILASVEKKKLVQEAATLEASWAILDAQAGAFAITTERTAAANARTAWLAMLAAISPPWNDTDVDSPVSRTTYNNTRTTYDEALEDLSAKIKEVAATLADWDGITGSDKPEDKADVTRAIGFGPAEIVIRYDYTGAAEDDELPRDQVYKLFKNGAAQTSGVTWTYTVLQGTLNGFDLADGEQALSGSGSATLSVTSLGSDFAVAELKAVQGTLTTRAAVRVSKSVAPPPPASGGGGGVIASKSSAFATLNSTTYADMTGTMMGTMPAGDTTATLAASLTLAPSGGSPADSWTIQVKWQRLIAAVWTDVGSAASSDPDPSVTEDPGEIGSFIRNNGAVVISVNDTGLTGGASHSWRLMGRLTAGSRNISVSGNATVTA